MIIELSNKGKVKNCIWLKTEVKEKLRSLSMKYGISQSAIVEVALILLDKMQHKVNVEKLNSLKPIRIIVLEKGGDEI